MKKSIFSLLAGAFLFVPAIAQVQVDTQADFADYDRCSVSFINILYGDKYDEIVDIAVDNFDAGKKFDWNAIYTVVIKPDSLTRFTDKEAELAQNGAASTQTQNTGAQVDAAPADTTGNTFGELMDKIKGLFSGIGSATKPDPATQKIITAYLNEHNIGKEILNYILAPDAEGVFTRKVLDKRGRNNMIDRDVIDDEARQVQQEGQDADYTLIRNSYIVVYDMKNPKRTEDENGKVTWSATVTAYVYEMENADKLVANVLDNMWINPNDNSAARMEKRAAFRDLRVPLKLAGAAACIVTDETLEAALASSYDATLLKLEKQIKTWQVTADCETVCPYITAKIGTKEGLKNGQRYAIYGQKFDKKTNGPKYRRLGYARVTEVANTDGLAKGNTDSTFFYQISGVAMRKDEASGKIVKQSNDIRLGVSLGYNYNGLKAEQRGLVFGSYSMLNLTFEELGYIHKNGIKHYARVNFGYDLQTGKMLREGAALFNEPFNDIFASGVSFINVSMGYGIGLPATRYVDIQPFFNIGADFMVVHAEEPETTTTGTTTTSEEEKNDFDGNWFIDPGLRIAINCGYPFQVFVQADYAAHISYSGKQEKYKNYNEQLMSYGFGHFMGLGLSAGIKWTF